MADAVIEAQTPTLTKQPSGGLTLLSADLSYRSKQ
jgi:hypothetical protein